MLDIVLPIPKSKSFNAFANAGYMTNDVVSLTATDISSGRKITTYENIAGNWNANGRVMLNMPFKNIKFSLILNVLCKL